MLCELIGVRWELDCKTVGFFSKSIKKSVKRGVRVLRARSARASHARRACETREKKPYFQRISPVSLSVFSLVPDLLFDCSRLLEYSKIRTVLQSRQQLDAIAVQIAIVLMSQRLRNRTHSFYVIVEYVLQHVLLSQLFQNHIFVCLFTRR